MPSFTRFVTIGGALLSVLINQSVAHGQDVVATPHAVVPFEERTVSPRTMEEVFGILDALVADNQPPSTVDGSISVVRSTVVEVQIDGETWFDTGRDVITPSAGDPVDGVTEASIRQTLRQLVACRYHPGQLRLFCFVY